MKLIVALVADGSFRVNALTPDGKQANWVHVCVTGGFQRPTERCCL